jgi:hypothetical protein
MQSLAKVRMRAFAAASCELQAKAGAFPECA